MHIECGSQICPPTRSQIYKYNSAVRTIKHYAHCNGFAAVSDNYYSITGVYMMGLNKSTNTVCLHMRLCALQRYARASIAARHYINAFGGRLWRVCEVKDSSSLWSLARGFRRCDTISAYGRAAAEPAWLNHPETVSALKVAAKSSVTSMTWMVLSAPLKMTAAFMVPSTGLWK